MAATSVSVPRPYTILLFQALYGFVARLKFIYTLLLYGHLTGLRGSIWPLGGLTIIYTLSAVLLYIHPRLDVKFCILLFNI